MVRKGCTKNIEIVTTPHLDLKTCFSFSFSRFEANTREYFKVCVTISLYQLLIYQRWYSWSLVRSYSQYIACLKLGVNTKLVLGLP